MMKKIMATLMAAVLLVSALYSTPVEKVEAASLTTFAQLDYGFSSTSADIEASDDSKDYTLNKSKYGSKSAGYKFTTGNGSLYASIDGSSKRKLEWTDEAYSCSVNGKPEREPAMTAGKKNPWKAGSVPYFEINTSTSGYTGVNFSAYVGASKKGPRDYRISYAVGSSSSFTVLSGTSLSLSDNKVMTKISGKLPAAADNQSVVRIRVEIYSLKAVDTKAGSLLSNTTSGEACINHIVLQGEKKSTASSNTANKAVTTKKKVSAIYCAKKKLTIRKGKKKTIAVSVTVSPKTSANINAVKSKLTYKSSNKKIATVTKKGVVKAKKKGSAKITITYSKKIKATCRVKVK